MALNPEEFSSLERKIGEIVGLLTPIPGQINTIFAKLDEEKEVRSDNDAKIKSDLRSVKEQADRSEAQLNALQQKTGNIRCSDHAKSLEEMRVELANFANLSRDIIRLFNVNSEGRSRWVDDTERDVGDLKTKVENLREGKKTLKDFAKKILDKVVTIAVTLLIAWLALKFGLK